MYPYIREQLTVRKFKYWVHADYSVLRLPLPVAETSSFE